MAKSLSIPAAGLKSLAALEGGQSNLKRNFVLG
jgi:hypothetical protein